MNQCSHFTNLGQLILLLLRVYIFNTALVRYYDKYPCQVVDETFYLGWIHGKLKRYLSDAVSTLHMDLERTYLHIFCEVHDLTISQYRLFSENHFN